MSISKFYDRNKPIFTLGAVMAIVFIGLIIFYRLKPREETKLSEINELDQQFYKVAYDEQTEEYNENSGFESFQQDNETVEPELNVDELYGVIEINYTEEGFKPRIVKAYIGQNVTWKNNSETTLYFEQRIVTYPELGKTFEVKPGESFSQRMTELGTWPYIDNKTYNFGSINVKELPRQ